MNVELEARLGLADDVLAAVAALPESTVGVVAQSLVMAGGRLEGFGDALDCQLHGSPQLARLKVARELACLADDAELRAMLQDARQEPWLALREALETVQAAA